MKCLLIGIGMVVLTSSPALSQESFRAIVGERVPCAAGEAAGFGCERIDLLAFLPISDIGGATVRVNDQERPVTLNDIWGWTDPETGREYALVGRSDGTAFVDLSDPTNPVYLGILPSHEILAGEENDTLNAGEEAGGTGAFRPAVGNKTFHEDKGVSSWRDVKVYGNHALVVADASPNHGIQFFDLTQLRDVADAPATFEESAHYAQIGSAHNVAVNEASGFAYAVGASGGTGDTCGGGLHMVDVRLPDEPTFAGCFADTTTGYSRTGYSHDVQCVVYHGPDAAYEGREICLGSNETAISISDVTEKSAPFAISTGTYPEAAYVHQGWLTPDHRYFLQDDELDESQEGGDARTRTIIWDVSDLDNPYVLTYYEGTTTSVDHNLYVVDHFVFQANYKSGLRVLDIRDISSPHEVAFFDTYPASDGRGFDGAWSNYPFFESGIVIVSSIREGLFVLDPVGASGVGSDGPDDLRSLSIRSVYPNPFQETARVALNVGEPVTARVELFDVLGRRVDVLHRGHLGPGVHPFEINGAVLPDGTYFVKVTTAWGSAVRGVTLVR